MQVEDKPLRKTKKDRRAIDPALASLSLAQAMAVAPHVTTETGRIAIRNGMLLQIRGMIQNPRTCAEDGARIARELRQPADLANPYSVALATICALSRNGTPPGQKTIERVLLSASA